MCSQDECLWSSHILRNRSPAKRRVGKRRLKEKCRGASWEHAEIPPPLSARRASVSSRSLALDCSSSLVFALVSRATTVERAKRTCVREGTAFERGNPSAAKHEEIPELHCSTRRTFTSPKRVDGLREKAKRWRPFLARSYSWAY